jgi:S-DNA-T family DNA segregation ATPase FtsK/SpoIIIE
VVPAPRPGAVRATGRLVGRQAVYLITTARAVATHDTTRATGKTVARQVWFPIAGAGVAVRRWRDSHGASRYERMMRAAETAGDRDAVLEWEARDVAEKQARHDRVMDWVYAPVAFVRAAAVGLAAIGGLLLVLGTVLAVGHHDIGQVLAPIGAVIGLIVWVAWFLSAYGALLLTLATVAGVGWLWHLGRTHTQPPAWVAAPAGRDDEVGAVVTADAIVTALAHLPIPKLREGFKNGWVPRFELTPVREGQGVFRGYRAIFDLPMSVTPTKLADFREVFARNLHRNAVEVWISDHGRERGGRPGFVNLYVADAGVMDKPTPTYPLLNDGTADVFAGVPIGITQRGDAVMMPVNGSNSVFGGQPGQGKSNAVRVAVVGVALDPIAEIQVHVFALNGDFDAFTPRLSRYEKGAGVEHVAAAAQHLDELHQEVERREGRLAQLGAKKLTRAIAIAHPDMRPLLVGFSECHEMFSHAEHGKVAAERAVAVIKRGRKTGVTLVFDTQSSRADAIPSQLVENVGFNGCFAVKTWRSNDGFLGDGSFAAGIRATELRFNVDRGTMVATGASEEAFDIVRTYFLEVDDDTGFDQATEIIERAMAALDPATPADGAATPAAAATVGERDLLDDLDAVLDNERVPAADLPARLRDLAPDWEPYRRLTGTGLRADLAALGVKVASTGNKYPVDPVTVRAQKARRDAARAAAARDPDRD